MTILEAGRSASGPRPPGYARPPLRLESSSSQRRRAPESGRVLSPPRPGAPPSPCPRSHASMSTPSTPLVWAAEAAGESDIPFCLSGVAGSSGSGCPRGGRVDGAVEVFSSITRRGRGLTKGRCQRCWPTLLTRFRRGCLLEGLAAETTRRMIAIPWQIVPFRDRVRRGGAVGSACCWPTQVPLARSVVAGRQPTSTRYVEALVSNRAFPLRR